MRPAALTHLTLLNSSFRPHSHTAPATLAPFLASLTHLTMANVGLPQPSSHLTDMLRCCAPTLRYLAISSLRDIDAGEFRRAFEVLIERGAALETLVVGFLTEQQVSALQTSSASAQTSGGNASFNAAASEEEGRPLLSRLPVLENLTFTLPLPPLPPLLAFPPSLRQPPTHPLSPLPPNPPHPAPCCPAPLEPQFGSTRARPSSPSSPARAVPPPRTRRPVRSLQLRRRGLLLSKEELMAGSGA